VKMGVFKTHGKQVVFNKTYNRLKISGLN